MLVSMVTSERRVTCPGILTSCLVLNRLNVALSRAQCLAVVPPARVSWRFPAELRNN